MITRVREWTLAAGVGGTFSEKLAQQLLWPHHGHTQLNVGLDDFVIDRQVSQ